MVPRRVSPIRWAEDGGKLDVHTYCLEQTHIVYMSVSLLSTIEGLEPHQLLVVVDDDVGVVFHHGSSSLCRRVARLSGPMQ
jgi:hypothetical protein